MLRLQAAAGGTTAGGLLICIPRCPFAAAADILLTQRDAITNWNAYAAANGLVGWNLSYPVRRSTASAETGALPARPTCRQAGAHTAIWSAA